MPTFKLQQMILPVHLNEAAAFISDPFEVTNEFATQRLERYKNQLEGSWFHYYFTKMLQFQDTQRISTSDKQTSLVSIY